MREKLIKRFFAFLVIAEGLEILLIIMTMAYLFKKPNVETWLLLLIYIKVKVGRNKPSEKKAERLADKWIALKSRKDSE